MGPTPRPVLDYADTRVPRPARRRLFRLVLILACLYLPYAWLLKVDYPWSDYRLHWLKMWPVLPGLIAGLFAIPHDDKIVYGAMTAMTALVLAVFGLCAWRGNRRVFLLAAIIALVGSVANAWIAYGVFRA